MFSKPKVILYVHKNGITFYIDKESAGLQFDFEEDVVKGYELKNSDKLKAQLASFIKDNFNGNFKVILLLSEEIVLEKSILAKSAEDQHAEIQKFIDEAPFKNVSKLLYKMSGILQVIATNADIYLSVIDILEQNGWQVEAVVPIRIFGQFAANDILTEDELNSINSKSKVISEGNLLVENQSLINETKKEHSKQEDNTKDKSAPQSSFESSAFQKQKSQKTAFTKTLLLGVFIAVVFFLIGFFILQLKLWSKLPFNMVSAPTPTTAPSPSPTPTPIPLSKANLNVEVLNGTGKAGQAGLVKYDLTALGYKNITTDNASSQSNTTTTIEFDSKVGKDTQDELVTALKKVF